MEDLTKRIEEAKRGKGAMNTLVSDYLPFLRKEISKYESFRFDYDERLSLAMLTFVNCVNQYDQTKGNFVSFLSASIRYRLIDQSRLRNKDRRVISLDDSFDDGESGNHVENRISMQKYQLEKEEDVLKEEIERFNDQLKHHSLSFCNLKDSCPKQKRSRKLCMKLAAVIANNPYMRNRFKKTGRLPREEAALMTGVSVKSVEKYRNYIVGLVILLLGDYPAIMSFIPVQYDDSPEAYNQ